MRVSYCQQKWHWAQREKNYFDLVIDLFIGNKGLFLSSKDHFNIHCDLFFAVLVLLRGKNENLEAQKKNSAILPFLKGHWWKH